MIIQKNPYPLDEYLYRQYLTGFTPTVRIGVCGSPYQCTLALYLQATYGKPFRVVGLKTPNPEYNVLGSEVKYPLPEWAIVEARDFDELEKYGFGVEIRKALYDQKMMRDCDGCHTLFLVAQLTPICKTVDLTTGMASSYDWWCAECMELPRQQQEETDANSELIAEEK